MTWLVWVIVVAAAIYTVVLAMFGLLLLVRVLRDRRRSRISLAELIAELERMPAP